MKRFRDLAVVLDESTVEIAYAQERLYAPNSIRWLLCLDHLNVSWVHADPLCSDDKT